MNDTNAQKKADKAQRKAAAKAAAEEELLANLEAKARQQATKKGLDIPDDALLVAHNILTTGTGPETLVVWPDRVEKYVHEGFWFKGIDSVESMLIANITSVGVTGGMVYVNTNGNSISFVAGKLAAKARAVIFDLTLKESKESR